MNSLSRFLVAATFAACAGSAAVLVLGPERVPLLSYLQYLPYWAYLAPALVALAISSRLGWRWRVAAALSGLLTVLVIMDFRVGSAEPGLHRVRVMTFNVKDYETLVLPYAADRIEGEVRRYDPDVVVMQDAADFGATVRARNLFAGHAVYVAGEYVLVSRYPLSGCEEVTEDAASKRFHHVACEVRAPEWRLQLHVAHLVSPRRGLNALRYATWRGLGDWEDNVAMRIAQARVLARFVSRSAHPAIVAGDLNAPPHSLVLRELADAGYRDAFSAAGLGFGFTYGQSLRPGLPFLRLDHVLVDRSIGIADCFAAPSGISSHRPVIADLLLGKPS